MKYANFPIKSNVLFAIYDKPVIIKEMDIVVENEFYTQKKVQCERYYRYLSKVLTDY